MTHDPVPPSESEARRFICDFRIPGELMPMFVIGKPLSALTKGALAAVRVIDGKLTVMINNEPAFRLERLSTNTFSISGLPPGITLQFHEENNVMQQVVLDMKGLPKDLYSARLGMFVGPAIAERRVPLAVLGGPRSAPGSMA